MLLCWSILEHILIMVSLGLKLSTNFLRATNLSLFNRISNRALRPFSTHSINFCTIEKSSQPTNESKTVDDPTPKSTIEKELNEKIEKLQLETNDFKDKYQRTLADRENLRNRLLKEISDAKLYGIQGFCKDLLEVTDVFRKAIESVPEDKTKSDAIFKSLYDGVVMTESQLHSVLKRHGLTQILPSMGDKFDPAEQEAMFEVPPSSASTEAGTVAHIVRNGWKLHERCIRSAQVGVVKG